MLREKAFKIGHIIKTHGVSGQLLVSNIIKISETDEWPDWIFLDIDSGLVPFRTNTNGMLWRDEKHLILELQNYDDLDKVQKFVGLDVWFPNEFKSQIAKTINEVSPFVGYMLLDQNGTIVGRIEELIDLPNNPLFRLEIESREVLIPAREEWILDLDEDNSRITMDLPDGLLEL